MRQALTFQETDYYFDIESLKQFSLMSGLNYTYLCILLQRARFSAVKQGQHIRAEYEPDFMIYMLKGRAIIKNQGKDKHIDEMYKEPLFDKNSQAEVVFTEDSFLVRIERQLYEIFHKSMAINKTLN